MEDTSTDTADTVEEVYKQGTGDFKPESNMPVYLGLLFTLYAWGTATAIAFLAKEQTWADLGGLLVFAGFLGFGFAIGVLTSREEANTSKVWWVIWTPITLVGTYFAYAILAFAVYGNRIGAY